MNKKEEEQKNVIKQNPLKKILKMTQALLKISELLVK